MWEKTELKCKDHGLRVSITAKQPGKIEYHGSQAGIRKARQLMGEISEVDISVLNETDIVYCLTFLYVLNKASIWNCCYCRLF